MRRADNLSGIVAFGFVMTFSSGLGQTFFISLFNADLREAFDLSHGEIGSLYFAGTLSSAIVLIWAGKLLDVVDIRIYTLCVCLGLTVACLVMSSIQSAATLAIAFFLLRLFGQGLSGHTGITTAARSHPEVRGKVLSFSGLGFSFAEMTMPIATVWLLTIWHWREVWQWFAGLELLVIVALSQWLLWRFHINSRLASNQASQSVDKGWNRSRVIRDRRFWQIAPAIFAPSIISTGLFFHQQSLAATKGFSMTIWASAIAAYSVSAVVSSLVAGLAVDRWSGSAVSRLLLLPFIVAVLAVATTTFSWLPFLYYALMGMTAGIATPAVNALWVELYGSTHVAAIRALVHALMVFGTALGPVFFGTLLDHGYTWNFLLIISAGWMAVASILMCLTSLPGRQPIDPKMAG